MTVAILVPVLRRPHRVRPLLESIVAATPEPHRVLFVATAGDEAELAAIDAEGADVLVVPANARGDYAVKINRGYQETAEPFLFCAADDLHFHPGWLPAALKAMANAAVGVVGTNDLGSKRVMAGEHSTHSLIRRSYIDQYGTVDESRKVLCDMYPHEFVDDELVETAKHRGAWWFAADSIVEHLHPNWGKGDMDELYAQQAQRMRLGRKIFMSRRHMWT